MSVYDFKWQTASLIFQVAILRDREITRAGFQLSVNAKAPSTDYTDPQRPDIHFFVFLSENLLVCKAGENSTLNFLKKVQNQNINGSAP